MENEVAQAEQPVQEASPAMGQQAEQPADSSEVQAYTPREDEKHLYHVMLDQPRFDSKSGKKLSKSYVQKFTQTEFANMTRKKDEKDKSYLQMLGYEIKVLWDPTKQI